MLSQHLGFASEFDNFSVAITTVCHHSIDIRTYACVFRSPILTFVVDIAFVIDVTLGHQLLHLFTSQLITGTCLLHQRLHVLENKNFSHFLIYTSPVFINLCWCFYDLIIIFLHLKASSLQSSLHPGRGVTAKNR